MPSNITALDAFTAPVVVPLGTDARNAASIQAIGQTLADRTQFAYNRSGAREVATIAALKALTGMSTGHVVSVATAGRFRYDSTITGGVDTPFEVAPNSGGGRWFHDLYTVAGAPGGVAKLDAGGLVAGARTSGPFAVKLTNVTWNTAAFNTTSTTYVAVTGMKITLPFPTGATTRKLIVSGAAWLIGPSMSSVEGIINVGGTDLPETWFHAGAASPVATLWAFTALVTNPPSVTDVEMRIRVSGSAGTASVLTPASLVCREDL